MSSRPTTPKRKRSVICVSDTHCGCRLAICHPEPFRLDDGGFYTPSEWQQALWGLWREFWDEWVPSVTRREPYDLVINGDSIEGVHHRATTPISHNIEDQLRMAELVLKPVAEKCRKSGGHLYVVRGTNAHVGESGLYEEQLAQRLGAVPNARNQYARNDLWLRVGSKQGPLVHFLHHVGTTSSAAHETSAVNAELTAEFTEAARWRREPPDFVVRSHRHRSCEVGLNGARGYCGAIVTPAWQGKTPFAWKVPGARISEPQMGGIIIREGDEEFYYRRWVKTLDREPEVWTGEE